MEDKANIFWKKFLEIKDILMDIDSLDDAEANKILIQLDNNLKTYSSGIDFELEDITTEGRELVFTASGDEDYFEDVIVLVQTAPIMDFWKITAFAQPKGKNQQMEFENIKLASNNLLFLPMDSEEIKDKIGVQISAKGLNKNDNTLSCAYLLCEKMIGEYNATTLIDYFDIVAYEDNMENNGFLPLDYLPDYVEWKIEQIEARN